MKALVQGSGAKSLLSNCTNFKHGRLLPASRRSSSASTTGIDMAKAEDHTTQSNYQEIAVKHAHYGKMIVRYIS